MNSEATLYRDLLQDLVTQIQRCDPVDDQGHPLKTNGAYIKALKALSSNAPFEAYSGWFIQSPSPGCEHRVFHIRIRMENRQDEESFNGEVVTTLRAYCDMVVMGGAGNTDNETIEFYSDYGTARVDAQTATYGTMTELLASQLAAGAMAAAHVSGVPLEELASAISNNMPTAESIARGDLPPKQTFELLDQLGASGGLVAGAIERLRQIAVEGFTEGQDNAYYKGELRRAAATYALPAGYRSINTFEGDGTPDTWPWAANWWKPGDNTPAGRKRDCEKAIALLAAEWDRIDRMERRGPPTAGESA